MFSLTRIQPFCVLIAVAIASALPPLVTTANNVDINDYCEFASNTAGIDGGAIYMYYTPSVDITSRVSFSQNEVKKA